MIINRSVEVSLSEKEVEEGTMSRDSESGKPERKMYIYIFLTGLKMPKCKMTRVWIER